VYEGCWQHDKRYVTDRLCWVSSSTRDMKALGAVRHSQDMVSLQGVLAAVTTDKLYDSADCTCLLHMSSLLHISSTVKP